MTVNKGLLSIVENTPNFSNQSLENAVNEIKAVDQDDGYQFIKSQFDVDTAIRTNNVLSTSQKNDALETLNAVQPHLQIGRILTDVVRHTASIVDATIIPLDDADNPTPATFLEILQQVQTVQGLVPELYGVPAKDKSRAVNDHLGTLNNIFLTTEDSTAPVFTRLKEIMQLIDTNARTTTALNIATAAVRVSNNDLVTFLNSVVADSTDFQTTLDNRVNTTAGNMANLNTRISQIPGDPTTDLVAIKDEITDQVSLENSNLVNIGTYIETLSNNTSFAALAEDNDLRILMSRVAQNKQWQTYFEDYNNEKENLNPIYTTDTDSDKSAVIDQVLADSGLPDVSDPTDLVAVAAKARRDNRIDTANYDRYTVEQQINDACKQLGITTANRTITALSGTLLNNMNQHDRDTVAKQLDSNESANTLS
jgi:hypothetical protein